MKSQRTSTVYSKKNVALWTTRWYWITQAENVKEKYCITSTELDPLNESSTQGPAEKKTSGATFESWLSALLLLENIKKKRTANHTLKRGCFRYISLKKRSETLWLQNEKFGFVPGVAGFWMWRCLTVLVFLLSNPKRRGDVISWKINFRACKINDCSSTKSFEKKF